MDNPHADMLTVALLTMGNPHRLSGGYGYHLRMAEAAPHHDARVAFISLPDRSGPLAWALAPLAVQRARDLGAEVLLLDSIAAAPMAPWLGLSRPHPPLVAILHQPPGGIDHGPCGTRAQAPWDRLAYRRAGRLIAASDALASELIASGMDPDKVVVVPPGWDVNGTGPWPSTDLRQGRAMALLCVGNWLPRKGIHEVLAAIAGLPDPAVTLHLAGDDRADAGYAEAVHRRAARPDLAGRVVVHGHVSRAEVARLYHSADAFVLPSVREPYGTVYGEAMAAGLPVLGWRAGNLPHLARDGEEGFILRTGDVTGLSQAILRLSGDERLRRRLGAAARRRAAQRPRWEEVAAMFFAAIRQAITG